MIMFFLLTSACARQHSRAKGKDIQPELTEKTFISFDGAVLPLRKWLPAGEPEAVFIAIHGFNDYSNFMKDTALFFTERNLAVYAYDQRGFGEAPGRCRWAGVEAMTGDLKTLVRLLKKQHPAVPLYLLGDSMGGAVVMVAMTEQDYPDVDGVILVAPAVWSRATMPFYQRWLLWLARHLMPWAEVTGKHLDITPSDNDEMLRELGRDPLMIKKSRIDTLHGLVNLMDAAYGAGGGFEAKTLVLYGDKDEIIPRTPVYQVFESFRQADPAHKRFVLYPNGYHMLLRDLQARTVLDDIAAWLADPGQTLPSVSKGAARMKFAAP